MSITQTELRRQLAIAKANGWDAIAAEAERARGLPPRLLLAVASRETDMQDVVGDGGHGRGLFQIDDRAWPEWLAAHGAGGREAVPPVADAARHAASILADNLVFGRRQGVPDGDLLKFAISGYNAGPGGALAGFTDGDSDLRTTGGDYAADVLRRQRLLRGRRRAVLGPVDDGILRTGTTGDAVLELKRRLARWFDLHSPGEWASLAVPAGPEFGRELEAAVRVLQERLGLLVDGEVGPQTLGALGVATTVEAPLTTPDLVLPGPVGPASAGQPVRLVQGWLTLNGFPVVVDGEFGPASGVAVTAFQADRGLAPTGVVDLATYDALTQPMQRALARLAPRGRTVGELAVAYGRKHVAAEAREVGGQNRGPWVRLYTGGLEGEPFPWCAGFATFCLRQAAATLGAPSPVPATLACGEIASAGRERGRFVASPSRARRGRLPAGTVFLRRDATGALEYAHCGVVVEADTDTFTSIEGNTNDDGSAEGYEVCARTRGYGGIDFVLPA